MTSPAPDEPAEVLFAKKLEELVELEEWGSLARLRRSLGHPPGTYRPAFPVLMPIIPRDAKGWREDVYWLVAGLWAMHPEPGDGNFGAAMRHLRPDRGQALDTRMVQLLASDTSQLPPLLRRAFALLTRARVGLDWAQLLRDLWGWNRDDARIQRDWAKAYWSED